MANIRAAYAEVTANQLTGEGDASKDVNLTQEKAGWTETPNWPEDLDMKYTPVDGDNGTVTVTYNTTTKKCEVAKS